MSALRVINPLPIFLGADGKALQGGYVYVGNVNQDPIQFPKAVYFDQALSIPASQPLRTQSGYLYRNGAPATLWADGDCSILVLDANRQQVSYQTQYATGVPRGMEASALSLISVTTAHAAAVAGGTLAINSVSATTQTLPAASAVRRGSRIEFINIQTGTATVSRAGADTIQLNSNVISSVALGHGDTLTLESDGTSKWYGVAGSAQLGSAAVFGVSLGGSGYQMLPSGMIIQRGSASTVAGNGTITFPIAFPNACLQLVMTEAAASGWSASNFGIYGQYTKTVTGASVKSIVWNGSAFTLGSGGFDYIALGY